MSALLDTALRDGDLVGELRQELARQAAEAEETRRALLASAQQAEAVATISALLASPSQDCLATATTVVRLATEVLGTAALLRVEATEAQRGFVVTDSRGDHTDRAPLEPGATRWFGDLPLGAALQVREGAARRLRAEVGARAAGQVAVPAGSLLALPLGWAGRRLAVLVLVRDDARGYAPSEVSLAQQLTDHAALALANDELISDLGLEVSRRRAAEDLARRAASRERELLERVIEASRAEQRRIANDVHDDAVQVMTAALMRLGLARLRVDDPEGVLERTEGLVSEAIRRLRSLLFELSPPDLERQPLVSTLRRLAEEVLDASGCTVDVRATAVEVSGDCAETVFRVAREALVNVRKHAEATSVTLSLRRRSGGLLVVITDDGRGLPPGRPAGFGLTSARERLELAGGWLRLGGTREGTRLSFWLPTGLPGSADAGASA